MNNTSVRYNGSVFFSLSPINEIINLSDNTIFSWNFGEKNNTQKEIDDLRKYIQSEKVTQAKDFVGEKRLNQKIIYNHESSKYRICAIDYGELKFRYVFFDKETQKAVVFDKTKENIQFLFPDFYGESIIMYDRGIKSNPFIDLTYYYMDNLSEEQKLIIDSNNPEIDNPFLVKYNLKHE
ncbi:hypothetical protein [Viscerimonas tarda]